MNVLTKLANLSAGCAARGDTLAADICADAIREIERLRADSFDAVLNAVAGSLPDNRRIEVEIERGYAGITLRDDEDWKIDEGPVDSDESPLECLRRLVSSALSAGGE